MEQSKRISRKVISALLSLLMVLSCFSGLSLTAYAADEVSENISLVASPSANLKTISGTHYSVSCGYMCANDSGMQVCKSGALTINARKGETITKVVLTYSWGNNKSSLSASAGTFDGNATISDINAQQVTISSSNTAGVKISAVTVYFEGSLSNPTVTLTGGANAKSSGGLLTQSYLPGAMDTVTYTALTGAAFPEFETFTQNGVTVERTSDTVVTISGTPTANTEITVPDAESSSKMVTWGSSIINDSGRNGLEYQIRRNNSYSDTANGITLTKSGSGNVGSDWYTYGSLELNFTTATGKFTSIEIETSQIYDGGNWTKDGNTLKWNGTPSNSVSLSGSGLYLEGVSSINFVIEMPTVSVTITPGSNMTKTTDSGDAEQTGLTGAMADVVYTAVDGYYFPTNYSVAEVSGIKVTRDSYTQITVSGTPTADAAIALTAPTAKTTPDAPTAAATDCTTTDNNDGKLTGVTTEMEYKKSDAENWTAGTGSDITGLVPGTYYVRVKATETTNASTNQELTIKGFISYTVTFKVVNGKWNEGEGDAATADKTVTLTGHDGDTLKLTADQIPAVGTKPNDTYKAGSWDTEPSTDTAITVDTTYTYTYAQKSAITPTVSIDGWTYGETANEPSVDGNTGNGTVSYTYATKGSDAFSATVPTNAGNYTVKATIAATANYNGATATADFTIAKADPTYTAPTGVTATYGDTLANIALPTGWTWADNTASVGNAGTNTFKANFTPADTANYNTVNNIDVTVTVGKANPTYTAPTGLTATYGDTLSSVTLPSGWTWADGSQSVGNAGTKTFKATFTPADTTNYNTVSNIDVTVKVNKANPSYTVPTGLTATYGDLLSSVTLPTGWSWADGTQTVGNVGSNTFKANFTPSDTTNYNTVENVDVTVTVGKANPSHTVPSGLTATYGDTLADVTLPEGWNWVDATASVGNVGTNTFKANFTPTDTTNYNIVSNVDVSVTVVKADPTYTVPTGLTATYGDLLSSVTLPTGWSWADGTQTVGNVGTNSFKATFTPSDTTNYNTIEDIDVTVTVNKADAVSATVTANKLTCDGTEKALVTVTGEVVGGEMQYALGTDATTAPEDGWSTDVPAATNSSTYYVWYKVVSDDNHNGSTPACVEATIDPDYTVTEVTGLSGSGKDEWTKGGEDGVVITVKDSGEDNSFDHFVGVKLDGVALVKDVDYTVKKGSTILTLLPATLEKLSVGEHTVTILFDNGEVNTELTVKAANSGSATSPQTGDNSHMGLWIAIMILSLCALAATLFIGRKKRVFDR